MRNLQSLSTPQRRLVFVLMFVGVLLALIGVTALLVSFALNSGRSQGRGVVEGVTVSEFAALPDKDTYPASVTVGADGAIYTGSYSSGTIWRIDSAGLAHELPGTRDAIGSLVALIAAPDGSLLVIDRNNPDPRSAGGEIKQITTDGRVMILPAMYTDATFIAPSDIALDAAGNIYVSDSGRSEVWRFTPDGSSASLWWHPVEGDQRNVLTGMAYDSTRDALIVTDAERNLIHRIPVDAPEQSEIIYTHGQQPNPPGFNGAVVTPDGVLYVAALGQNSVVRVDADNVLTVIARDFRGASDVAFAAPNQLYVTNFDQSSLVLPLVSPHLPFALDVLTLP